MKLAPSILSASFARIGEAAQWAEQAGADWLHVDVMDGHFVPVITFGPAMVRDLKRITRLPLDVHLMVANPAEQVPQFISAGADHITVHVECGDMRGILETIRATGRKAGVALNPDTPVSALSPYVGLVDEVMVMTVTPGAGGQPLMDSVLPKFVELRAMFGEGIELVADGGVNALTLAKVKAAGAMVAVAGSAVFGKDYTHTSVQAAIAGLRGMM